MGGRTGAWGGAGRAERMGGVKGSTAPLHSKKGERYAWWRVRFGGTTSDSATKIKIPSAGITRASRGRRDTRRHAHLGCLFSSHGLGGGTMPPGSGKQAATLIGVEVAKWNNTPPSMTPPITASNDLSIGECVVLK